MANKYCNSELKIERAPADRCNDRPHAPEFYSEPRNQQNSSPANGQTRASFISFPRWQLAQLMSSRPETSYAPRLLRLAAARAPAFEIEPTGVGSFAGSVRGTKNEVMRKTRFPKKPLANFDFRRRCGATVVDFRRRNNAYGTSMALCRGDSIGLFLAIDYKSTAE
jgi:hypothetical protein